MQRVFQTPGGSDKNKLPSGSDPAHWAERQNLVLPLMRRSKTDAWTLSVRWSLLVGIYEDEACQWGMGLYQDESRHWEMGTCQGERCQWEVITVSPVPGKFCRYWVGSHGRLFAKIWAAIF